MRTLKLSYLISMLVLISCTLASPDVGRSANALGTETVILDLQVLRDNPENQIANGSESSMYCAYNGQFQFPGQDIDDGDGNPLTRRFVFNTNPGTGAFQCIVRAGYNRPATFGGDCSVDGTLAVPDTGGTAPRQCSAVIDDAGVNDGALDLTVKVVNDPEDTDDLRFVQIFMGFSISGQVTSGKEAHYLLFPGSGTFTIQTHDVLIPEYTITYSGDCVNAAQPGNGTVQIVKNQTATCLISLVEPAEASLVSLQKKVSLDPHLGTLTYKLTWTVTQEDADSLTISDPLPAGTSFLVASDGGALSADGTSVDWDLGPQLQDSSGSVTLTLLLDDVVNVATATVSSHAGQFISTDDGVASASLVGICDVPAVP